MTIDLSDIQFDTLLKRLHLANTRGAARELVKRTERDEWSYRDFLALLVSEEIAHRQQTRRMVRRAHFPFRSMISISCINRLSASHSWARHSQRTS